MVTDTYMVYLAVPLKESCHLNELLDNITFGKMAKVLIIYTNRVTLEMKKIKTELSFPTSDFVIKTDIETRQYNLENLVVHTGPSIDDGHYFCFSRIKEQLFLFDDAKVTLVHNDILRSYQVVSNCCLFVYISE